MMRLNTDPMTKGPRTGREQAEGMAVLIQVPRVDERHARVPVWRREAAIRVRGTYQGSSRPGPSDSFRAKGRPRRRLRRGVRRAGGSLLVLAAMAGTFTIGWTTRGGGEFRSTVLSTIAPARHANRSTRFVDGDAQWSQARPVVAVAVAVSEADAHTVADGQPIATAPDLGAPVADAEVPVVFPGYLLPDNSREEPAHEGS
jgi:hypothetical protein